MPRTLDRKRKYDTAYGETNMRYHQDGHYFDAQGNEVVQPEQQNREEPPLGAGSPAGQVPAGATSTTVTSDATVAPPSSNDELRARLVAMKAAQVKSIFKEKGGPEELSKGKGAVERMADWLVAQDAQERAAAQPPEAPPAE